MIKRKPETVADLEGLPAQAFNRLVDHDILTIQELTSKSMAELRDLKGLGSSTAMKIERALAAYDLTLRPENREQLRRQKHVKRLLEKRTAPKEDNVMALPVGDKDHE